MSRPIEQNPFAPSMNAPITPMYHYPSPRGASLPGFNYMMNDGYHQPVPEQIGYINETQNNYRKQLIDILHFTYLS